MRADASESLIELVDGALQASGCQRDPVLVLGERSAVAPLLVVRGLELQRVASVNDSEWASVQLPRQHSVVIVAPEPTMSYEHRVAQVHCAVQHVAPGGLIVTEGPAALERFGLLVESAVDLAGTRVTASRRTQRITIHDVVFAARGEIDRLHPDELHRRLQGSRPPFVVDTRTHIDRARFGVIPGSVHIPRTVLEWHLDPANGYLHAAAPGFDDPIVVVCNGGYSSSLAAANLVRLGFTCVADLVGGHHAWREAGLPVVDADHSHLDL